MSYTLERFLKLYTNEILSRLYMCFFKDSCTLKGRIHLSYLYLQKKNK